MSFELTADPAARTFAKLLDRNAVAFGNRIAYREKAFGIWQGITWAGVRARVHDLARGLIIGGLAEGAHVAVIGSNRPDLYMAMVAIQAAGGVPVPLYQDAVAAEMAYVLEHSGAVMAIVEDQEQVDKLIEIAGSLPLLRRILYLDPRGLRDYDHRAMQPLSEVIAAGQAAGPAHDVLAVRIAAGSGADVAVILYTSGTTGRPKGVVLTQDNILSTARASAAFDRLGPQDSVLAWLPMAWVGDFIFSMGQAYVTGFSVNCPESPATLQSDLREIGPTYFFAPPRFFEGLLTSVTIRMQDAGALQRWLHARFMALARRVGPALLDGRPVGLADRLLYRLGDLLLFAPLRNTLGLSRVRVGYTAGEAIGPEIFDFYRALGINLKQLYGQTEASVFITLQPDGAVRADTVGVPAPGVELRISPSGEVLYRSPGSFREYYRNPESTAETKDPEGWVSTGDAGYIEETSGQLRIIDRAKDVGRMQDGSLFAPKFVENKLKFYPEILEAVVFGRDGTECTAFLNIDLGAVGNWAERSGIAYASYTELAGHPRVIDILEGHVAAVNRDLAADPMLSGCQIARFLVLHKELDADDGELTRTRKVRRRIIEDRYAPLVAALAAGAASVHAETDVTYEDGRKGRIAATLAIRAAPVFPRARAAA